MKCRIDVSGRKIWNDNNNAYNTRPAETDIILKRDGIEYKTIAVSSTGDGIYKFPCLIVWNGEKKYVYTTDEADNPNGYIKTIIGYDIVNTLENVRISGVKTWDDNHNADAHRPAEIRLHLLQNNVEFDSKLIASPADEEETVEYDFGEVPFADAQGIPYVYQVAEDPVQYYETNITGFDITNIYHTPIIPFSFRKSSAATGAMLQNGVFELTKGGEVHSSAISDINGVVSFICHGTGMFQMNETLPPTGFVENIAEYQVLVSQEGTVTIDGEPSESCIIENQPIPYGIALDRAVNNIAAYNQAPNTWGLHGSGATDLLMMDKILITPEIEPVVVKWDYGTKDVAYFSEGGGNIVSQYANGIPISANGTYTVYAAFYNDFETVETINFDRIRDGSSEAPFLLIDYDTAESLEPQITEISQFVLSYMQGDGEKLIKNYEIYENINMAGKIWTPLGTLSASYVVADGFVGTLYGNGNDILNLTIDGSSGGFVGLFRGVASGATVENLGIIDSNIGGTSYPAGFAACVNVNDGSVTFKNLRLSGSVMGTYYAGGIISYANIANGLLDISDCKIEATVQGGSGVGGVMGICFIGATGELAIDGCYSTGHASGLANVSGIIGTINTRGGHSTISNCANAMTINASGRVGGILGILIELAITRLTISSCFNKGDIIAERDAGGIAGDMRGSSYESQIIIENCYNSGTVTINTTQNGTTVGGIAALLHRWCTIRNSYNIGDVTSFFTGVTPQNFFTGGISAYYGVIENCVSLGETVSGPRAVVSRISPYLKTAGSLNNNAALDSMNVLIDNIPKSPLNEGSTGTDGLSVTAAAAKTQDLYQNELGWDFADVWSFGNGEYRLPILKGIPQDLQPDILPAHL